MSDEAHPHEIIIVKHRHGGHEDGHHGGAWKIAYADFVTAMMAFFLVMWLISANDKTKAVIARYFNPVQLVDSTPQPPGLSDAKDKDANIAKPGSKSAPEVKQPKDGKEPSAGEAKGAKADPEGESKAKKEAEIFKDPAAALNEIAAKDAAAAQVVALANGKAQAQGGSAPTGGGAGLKGGEAFRDPFAPMTATATGDAADPAPAMGAHAGAATPAASVPATAPSASDGAAASAPLPADAQARAAELKSRIEAVVKAVAAVAGPGAPRIEVKATAEGTLISLADDARFTMFESASAEPSPRTVTLVGRIGKLLKEQKGQVVIRGFTDGRKFKSDLYDNWRLSSARADIAHHMLARGGLDEARIERIEGYADRQLRDPKNPDAPMNRRIEILLREQ